MHITDFKYLPGIVNAKYDHPYFFKIVMKVDIFYYELINGILHR